MKLEKQLILLGIIALIITIASYFVLGNKSDSGLFNTAFEFVLTTGLTFLILAINYFAITFFLRILARLFRTKRP